MMKKQRRLDSKKNNKFNFLGKFNKIVNNMKYKNVKFNF